MGASDNNQGVPLDADSDTATSRSPMSTSPVTLGDEIVSELLAVLPRLVERTQAQFGFIRAVAAKLGCNASNRTDDRSPAVPTLRIVTDADLPPATQVVATQATAKKAPARKAPAEKTPAKKAPAERTPARKAPAEKTPAKKAPAERTPARKAPAKKAPAKKAPAKKAPARKTATKQAPARTPRAASSGVAPAPTATPSVDELGIAAYDSLAASQVIPRLDSLSGVELDAVRRYEIAGRGRRTILTRVAQLQAG